MQSKENGKTQASELEVDTSVGTAADVEEVMKKYDRESNTRIWEGRPKQIVRALSIIFSLYSIFVTLFSTAMPEVRLNIFLGMVLILGYLHYPIKKGDPTGGKAIQRPGRLRSIEKARVPMDLGVDREKEPQFARSRKKPLGFLRESIKRK